jgi:DNA-binding NarL/FixJ family response regulator
MSQSANGARQPAVLIVEDQAPMREALYDLIRQSCPTLRVVDASDGATALAHFEAHQPALVLIDKNLPDRSGLDLTRNIKNLSPATMVAVISVESNAYVADQALAAGAVAFIGKDKLFEEVVPLVCAAVTLTEWIRHGTEMNAQPNAA